MFYLEVIFIQITNFSKAIFCFLSFYGILIFCLDSNFVLHIVLSSCHPRGQLYEYQYDRILGTLDQNFPAFKSAFVRRVFAESKAEAANLSKQPLPSNFSQDDIDNFNYNTYYKELGEEAPVLRAAVSGSMGTNFNFSEIEVNLVGSCVS